MGRPLAAALTPAPAAPAPAAPGARDELTGLLAHDLKTPLAAIAMNLDYALSELEGSSDETVRSALEDCRNANVRAIRIVTDMADVVRLATGDYRPALCDFRISRVIERTARGATADAAAREVCIVWSADDTFVAGEPELFGRALDRVVERAARLARPGSTVTVEQQGAAVCVRAQVTQAPRDALARSLAVTFAASAMLALGGALHAEVASDRQLTYRFTLRGAA